MGEGLWGAKVHNRQGSCSMDACLGCPMHRSPKRCASSGCSGWPAATPSTCCPAGLQGGCKDGVHKGHSEALHKRVAPWMRLSSWTVRQKCKFVAAGAKSHGPQVAQLAQRHASGWGLPWHRDQARCCGRLLRWPPRWSEAECTSLRCTALPHACQLPGQVAGGGQLPPRHAAPACLYTARTLGGWPAGANADHASCAIDDSADNMDGERQGGLQRGAQGYQAAPPHCGSGGRCGAGCSGAQPAGCRAVVIHGRAMDGSPCSGGALGAAASKARAQVPPLALARLLRQQLRVAHGCA